MENIRVTHTEFMQDGMKCERTDATYSIDGKLHRARLPWLASAQEVRFHIIRQRQGYSNK
jgi:hypothetical protein